MTAHNPALPVVAAEKAIREALDAGPMLGPWFVDEDDRPGMAWNRHIVAPRQHTVCFMAHSDGKLDAMDEATAALIAACNPEAMAALLSHLAELRAANERLALDARRYQWLRQYPLNFARPEWGKRGAGLPLGEIFIDTADNLDTAIDAVIAAQGTEAGQ